jgi:hypothetical protein
MVPVTLLKAKGDWRNAADHLTRFEQTDFPREVAEAALAHVVADRTFIANVCRPQFMTLLGKGGFRWASAPVKCRPVNGRECRYFCRYASLSYQTK